MALSDTWCAALLPLLLCYLCLFVASYQPQGDRGGGGGGGYGGGGRRGGYGGGGYGGGGGGE